MTTKMNALEFFSGIGGMHYSLLLATKSFQVVAAFDINHNANQFYELNFDIAPIQKSVQHLKPDIIDKFSASLWLLSPPCQPYTRSGLQLGENDNRSEGLAYLMQLLVQVRHKPCYIFLENVVGFELSSTHKQLIDLLVRLGYGCKEWILTPTQFGIPNERPRYYLFASMGGSSSPLQRQLEESFDQKCIGEYLDESPEFNPVTWDRALDPHLYIDEHSKISGCFTKSYGHFGASGSFLQTKLDQSSLGTTESLGLRFFTPTEVARLHYFPADMKIPEKLSRKQQWKLLGNSVNVHVIAYVLRDGFNRHLQELGNVE